MTNVNNPRGISRNTDAAKQILVPYVLAKPPMNVARLEKPKKFDVILARYSDPHKQREESCDAQARKCRFHLNQLELEPLEVLVLEEKGLRGDLESRDVFNQLVALIKQGRVRIVIVDQQSRFSRGLNVRGMILDLIYTGGRFIAVGDGIDTIRPGWEDQVGLKEIHNRMEIRDTGWRVRRQLELMAEDPDGCAGDYPYGYGSVIADPATAEAWRGHGPKPRRKVVIDRSQAAVVRLVFGLFVHRQTSISKIVRYLNGLGSRVPKIGKGAWRYDHVRRMLANSKYMGLWRYGDTTTIRNSAAMKKQVPINKEQRASVAR